MRVTKAHLLTSGIVLAGAVVVAVTLGYCTPVPNDPFFELNFSAQQAALRWEYPAGRAVEVYLQAEEFYHPFLGEFSSALASRGEAILPELRDRLSRGPTPTEGYFVAQVLLDMEINGSYAVSADPELMRLLEAAVGSDRLGLSVLRRIREHGEASGGSGGRR